MGLIGRHGRPRAAMHALCNFHLPPADLRLTLDSETDRLNGMPVQASSGSSEEGLCFSWKLAQPLINTNFQLGPHFWRMRDLREQTKLSQVRDAQCPEAEPSMEHPAWSIGAEGAQPTGKCPAEPGSHHSPAQWQTKQTAAALNTIFENIFWGN